MIGVILRLISSRAAGPVAGLAALALALLLVAARVEVGRLERRIAASELARGAAVAAAAEARARQDERARQIEAVAVARIRKVREASQTLLEKVRAHVSSEADDRCVVPVGFVRLHDAAASGLPASGPAGLADDAASGTALSGVGAALVQNYGIARENAEQLKALQAWVRASAAAPQ